MIKENIYDMTDDELEKFNNKNAKKTRLDYEEFKNDLSIGKCWLCKEQFDYCDLRYPCHHWLLLPQKLRKRHLKNLFEKFTYDQLEGFLRWYVNAHDHAKHINDLRDEHAEDLARAVTIKFDDIEWSMQFGQSCIDGKHGDVGPHYHMQIKNKGMIFHSFSDNHIKLSDYGLWRLNIDLGNDSKIRRIDVDAAGIQDMFDNYKAEDLLSSMHTTDDYDNAQFHVQSLVIAEEGHTISGDDIVNLYEESKRTGKPVSQLLHKLQNVKTTVMVEPGPGIPEAAVREKHRGNKSKTKNL